MSDYGIDARTFIVNVPLATLAAMADDNFVAFKAIFLGEVRIAQLTNGATLAAGDGTNNRSLTVQNVTGAVSMHTLTSNGNAFTADTPIAFTAGTAANRRFASGDIIKIVTAFAGSGGALTAPVVVHLHCVYGMHDYNVA